jgi:hypothetical protein
MKRRRLIHYSLPTFFYLFQQTSRNSQRKIISLHDNGSGYPMDSCGVGIQFPVRVGFFFSPFRPVRFQGSPSSLWIKRPWRELDHSTPNTGEAKNGWTYTSTPPHLFMALSTGTNFIFIRLRYEAQYCDVHKAKDEYEPLRVRFQSEI